MKFDIALQTDIWPPQECKYSRATQTSQSSFCHQQLQASNPFQDINNLRMVTVTHWNQSCQINICGMDQGIQTTLLAQQHQEVQMWLRGDNTPVLVVRPQSNLGSKKSQVTQTKNNTMPVLVVAMQKKTMAQRLLATQTDLHSQGVVNHCPPKAMYKQQTKQSDRTPPTMHLVGYRQDGRMLNQDRVCFASREISQDLHQVSKQRWQ